MSLRPVHPNPFGRSGQLTYGIPQSGRVRLSIYDLRGSLVATVVDRTEPAGWRSVSWDGRDRSGHSVASGTYFARLEMNGQVDVRKMVLAR
jgi:flagellar hook assembly protein FlgD